MVPCFRYSLSLSLTSILSSNVVFIDNRRRLRRTPRTLLQCRFWPVPVHSISLHYRACRCEVGTLRGAASSTQLLDAMADCPVRGCEGGTGTRKQPHRRHKSTLCRKACGSTDKIFTSGKIWVCPFNSKHFYCGKCKTVIKHLGNETQED